MDDSDLDFSDLCSRLLKRKVRKKPVEERKTGDGDGEKSNRPVPSSKQTKKATNQPKKTRTKKDASSEPLGKVESEHRAVLQAVSLSQLTENGVGSQAETQQAVSQKSKGYVKEKVLSRMQQFKRADPQKLQHLDSIPTTSAEAECIQHPSSPVQNKELSADERLALRLQQELDKEYEAQVKERVVDVDQGGLFFCQLCFRDLSAMTPQLRTQHINRCLDQSESQVAAPAPAPAPPQPAVPECPICGKGFKSSKSRSTHLKRCSSDMGVPPAVLLQALQRQSSEAVSDTTAGQTAQVGGSKRRKPSDPSQPSRKRPKKTAQPMDEDTMVALALSRSLLDQEVEMERAKAIEVTEVKGAEPQISVGTALHWKPAAGAGKGKRRRKGAPAAPPPLLLRQDPEEALRRLQERVSLMLARSRTPSPPPTPTLTPSTLLPPPRHVVRRGRAEGETPYSRPPAPLWHKSALPAGYGHAPSDFYTPELSAFIQPYANPQISAFTAMPPGNAQEASHSQPPAADPSAQAQPRCPSPAASTPTSLLPSQAVQDLLDLGGKGLNLATTSPPQGGSHADVPDRLSGPTKTYVKANNSLSLSRLASDLSPMVNNPQLSDVQLQVDSGEVFFAHSFMLYARCPLLVEQVNASGFGVQEEGMPAAQRVLLGEVPSEAVLALLQFLYTAQCSLTPSLALHVQELASRFDLPELSQECQQYLHGLEQDGRQTWEDVPAQELVEAPEEQEDTQAQVHFLELLRSMWSSEDEGGGEEEGQGDGRVEKGERSVRIEEQGSEGEENGGEEHVDEEELEEIYEFAATQRKGGESSMRHETNSLEDVEEEEEGCGVERPEEEVWMCFETEEQKSSQQQSGEGNKRGGLESCKFVQAEIPAETGHCLRNTQGSSSPHKGGSETVMDTESTAEKVNQDSDQIHQADPAPSADANLDDSFNHLFSQSWGEYAEPSPTQATQKHQSRSKPEPVQVIDLSISPPPPTCEPSFPVPGLSPELTMTRGSQMLRMSLESTISQSQRTSMSSELTLANANQEPRMSLDLTITQASQRLTMSPELTTKHASQRLTMSPELTVTHASQRLTMSPELTHIQESQRLRLSLKVRESKGSQMEILPSNSQTQSSCTKQRSKEVELIVLSDSSDESPTCLSPSPPQPMCSQSPLILPEDTTGYTCIKDTKKAQDSLSCSKTAAPLKDSCETQAPSSDPSAKAHPSPSAPGCAWPTGSPGNQSLLDGSAEVSWLVPSTPHIPRIHSSSTQTESSMCRTRLFPGSSPPSSSSEAPGLSKSLSSNSISCKLESEDVSIPNLVSTTSHQTQTKVEGSRANVTLDDSPIFLPPKSLPRRFSSATDLTPGKSHCGASVDKLSSKKFGQPVSSTPLHSGLEPSMCSHLLTDSPFLSQVEKNQHVQDSGTASRGSVPSDGSPERRGSLGLSNLKDKVSPSRDQEEAHMSKSSCWQKDSREVSDPGSSETQGESKHHMSGAEEVDMNRVEDDSERGVIEEEKEDKDELLPQQSFSNYDEPAMPFDEPHMAYDDPPMAFEDQPVACDEPPAACDEPPVAYDEPPMAFDEPPMAFDDSWGFGDCGGGLEKPRFSLRLENSGDTSNLNSSTTPPGPQASHHSLPAKSLPQLVAADRTPTAVSPEPQPSTSALDPKLWDSWEEDEQDEGAGTARPLSERLGAVAPAKRVAQLRTPVASKKAGPLVPITPMPHYSDMDTPELKNKLNRFGVRPLPKKQMVQKLKEIFQYTHQLETSDSEEEAPARAHRPRPVSPPARSCAQSLQFKEPRAPPAVSPRKAQLSLDDQEPLSLSQSSNASSTSQDSERSNPELPLSDGDSSSDSEGPVTASQSASRLTVKLQAARRFILSDPELHSQVLQYRPLVLSQLQERLKAAGIRLGAAKLLDFLDAQCITFTTAKPGQKARRKRKKKAVASTKGVRTVAEGGARGRGGRGGRKRRGAAAAGGPD